MTNIDKWRHLLAAWNPGRNAAVPEIKRDSLYLNRAISAILTNCQELSTPRIPQ